MGEWAEHRTVLERCWIVQVREGGNVGREIKRGERECGRERERESGRAEIVSEIVSETLNE